MYVGYSLTQNFIHPIRPPHMFLISVPNTQVDFIWVNRDLGSFQWFLEVLAALEEEQRVVGAAMETFLSLHLYKTGAAPLSPTLPLASSIRTGRPDWDKVGTVLRKHFLYSLLLVNYTLYFNL